MHPREPGKQHIGFATAKFEQITAHHGARPILADRALCPGESRSCRFIDLVVVPAGADIGVHTHDDDAEELYVVISGTALMHLDDLDFPVTAGDVIVNRPGGTHGLSNPGPASLRLVVIEMPVCPNGARAASAASADEEGDSSFPDEP